MCGDRLTSAWLKFHNFRASKSGDGKLYVVPKCRLSYFKTIRLQRGRSGGKASYLNMFGNEYFSDLVFIEAVRARENQRECWQKYGTHDTYLSGSNWGVVAQAVNCLRWNQRRGGSSPGQLHRWPCPFELIGQLFKRSSGSVLSTK